MDVVYFMMIGLLVLIFCWFGMLWLEDNIDSTLPRVISRTVKNRFKKRLRIVEITESGKNFPLYSVQESFLFFWWVSSGYLYYDRKGAEYALEIDIKRLRKSKRKKTKVVVREEVI